MRKAETEAECEAQLSLALDMLQGNRSRRSSVKWYRNNSNVSNDYNNNRKQNAKNSGNCAEHAHWWRHCWGAAICKFVIEIQWNLNIQRWLMKRECECENNIKKTKANTNRQSIIDNHTFNKQLAKQSASTRICIHRNNNALRLRHISNKGAYCEVREFGI